MLRDRNAHLGQALQRRCREAERLRETTLFLMLGLAQFRDNEAANRIERTEEYVRPLAGWYAARPGAPAVPSVAAIDDLAKAAPLTTSASAPSATRSCSRTARSAPMNGPA